MAINIYGQYMLVCNDLCLHTIHARDYGIGSIERLYVVCSIFQVKFVLKMVVIVCSTLVIVCSTGRLNFVLQKNV